MSANWSPGPITYSSGLTGMSKPRAGMDGKMLGGCHALVIERVVALDAVDESYGHVTRQEGILAIGFLAAAPARVAPGRHCDWHGLR